MKASPRRCSECFPTIPSSEFFLRERFIKAHLDNVDLFIAPSEFLLQRYVDWGIPPERIVCEDYGRRPAVRLAEDRTSTGRATASASSASSTLQGRRDAARGDGELRRAAGHPAAPARSQPGARSRPSSRTASPSCSSAPSATSRCVGSYSPADLPSLMREIDWVVVPRRWWENSPLVIQEAFMQRRPVICSGIGGMAEKVTHGVNGLHFTRR